MSRSFEVWRFIVGIGWFTGTEMTLLKLVLLEVEPGQDINTLFEIKVGKFIFNICVWSL